MNTLSFSGLRADIKRELLDLQRVVQECQEVMRHEEWPDLAFTRTLGSLPSLPKTVTRLRFRP